MLNADAIANWCDLPHRSRILTAVPPEMFQTVSDERVIEQVRPIPDLLVSAGLVGNVPRFAYGIKIFARWGPNVILRYAADSLLAQFRHDNTGKGKGTCKARGSAVIRIEPISFRARPADWVAQPPSQRTHANEKHAIDTAALKACGRSEVPVTIAVACESKASSGVRAGQLSAGPNASTTGPLRSSDVCAKQFDEHLLTGYAASSGVCQ